MAESKSKFVRKALAIASALAVLICAACIHQVNSLVGFPDSYFTQYDLARKPLYVLWSRILTAYSLVFLIILWGKSTKFWRQWGLAVSILLSFLLAIVFYDRHLYQSLEHGQGG